MSITLRDTRPATMSYERLETLLGEPIGSDLVCSQEDSIVLPIERLVEVARGLPSEGTVLQLYHLLRSLIRDDRLYLFPGNHIHLARILNQMTLSFCIIEKRDSGGTRLIRIRPRVSHD